MSDLTGQTVADTYKDLIQVGNDGTAGKLYGSGANDTAIQYMQDGAGDDIPVGFKVNGDGAQDSQVRIGMAGTQNITLSSDNTYIKATENQGEIIIHAPGTTANITISSQDVDIVSSSLSLKYGNPQGEHAILTTDSTNSVLQWGPPADLSSTTHAMQTIVTQSYESHAAGSSTMLNSNRVQNVNPNTSSGTCSLPALSAGAIICVINGQATHDLAVNYNGSAIGTALSPGIAAQYVSNDTTWIRIS